MDTFEIRDIPSIQDGRERSSKYQNMAAELLKLPPGKALVVSRDAFGTQHAVAALRGQRRRFAGMGKKLRSRKLPDGWYLWLEDAVKRTTAE